MSYILSGDRTFNNLILEEIEKHSFFRTNNIRNYYIQKVLKKKISEF